MSEPSVVVEGLGKSYGDRRALDDVSFRIDPGERVGYLGPNGAGKTTTLKLLVGLLRPDAGTIRISSIRRPGNDPRGRSPVGALLETPGAVPYLRARDWLGYVAAVQQVPARSRAAEVARSADATGVAAELDRPMGGLSTGLLRRVMISAALVGSPPILLLDEPTLGLDPAARHDLRRLLRRLGAEGTTVLLSSHLLDDVSEVCDRVLFLRDGRLVGDEPVRHPGPGPGAAARRVLRLDFRAPVDADWLASRLREGEEVVTREGRTADVAIPGSDDRQAELLQELVRAGGPGLLGLRRRDDGLTERYLELVGREEGE